MSDVRRDGSVIGEITREGILHGFQFRSGAWNDVVMYSKLRGDE